MVAGFTTRIMVSVLPLLCFEVTETAVLEAEDVMMSLLRLAPMMNLTAGCCYLLLKVAVGLADSGLLIPPVGLLLRWIRPGLLAVTWKLLAL